MRLPRHDHQAGQGSEDELFAMGGSCRLGGIEPLADGLALTAKSVEKNEWLRLDWLPCEACRCERRAFEG